MNDLPFRWIQVLICLGLLAGCTSPRPTLPLEILDPSEQISFVRDANELWRIDAQGGRPGKLLDLEGSILTPITSPGGRWIAFYQSGRKGHTGRGIAWWGLSSAPARLVVFDRETGNLTDLGTFGSPIVCENPKRLRGFRILLPQWSPDGTELLIADRRGIYRVSATGNVEPLVETDRFVQAIWTPDGRGVLYTDGNELYSLAIEENAPRSPARFHVESPERIGSLACSPDGAKIAFGRGCTVWVLDRSSNRLVDLHHSRHPIHWISWLPSGKRLVFLSGLTDREAGLMGSGWTAGVLDGHFRLFSIRADGTGLAELFHESRLDVRKASPALSPDGRFVAFVSRPTRSFEQVFVAATDGSGWRRVTSKGRCLWPSW